MVAVVFTQDGTITIAEGEIELADGVPPHLADVCRAFIFLHFPLGVPTAEPDADAAVAAMLARELRGEVAILSGPNYDDVPEGRVY